MCAVGVQDDQACFVCVGDISRVLGADVDSGESSAGLGLSFKALGDLLVDLLDMHALGLVLRAPRDVGLQVVPVSATGAVEVRRTVGQRRKCGVEVTRDIPGCRGSEEHTLGFQTLVRRSDRWRGTEEHSAREALGERALSK